MRKSIRTSLALAGAALGFLLVQGASAQTITATLNGVDPNSFPTMYLAGEGDLSGGCGALQWTGASGNTPPFNGSFDTYCIDLIQDINIGSTYTYTIGTLADAPNPGAYPNGQTGGMGAADADEIEELFGSHYEDTLDSGQLGEDNRAAFQLAIWNIVYDTDTKVDTGDGSLYAVSGFDANTISTADSWLTEAANPANQDLDATNVVALFGSDGAQDQVTLNGPVPTRLVPTSVPLPAPVAGSAVLIGLAALTRVSRKLRVLA